MPYRGLDVALIVPCFNEEAAIARVIRDLSAAMPALTIYVLDNRSTDATADVARAEGAHVISVPLRGKGNVVRRMFADSKPIFSSWSTATPLMTRPPSPASSTG
jgi:glycosyltransferase involved in cell wall biosynthesis